MKLIILSALFLLQGWAIQSVAAADLSAELKHAQQLLQQKNYAQAYPAFYHYRRHNPLAQFTLALFYQNGWGRSASAEKACVWFEIAAKNNIPAAQHFWAGCLMQQQPANVQQALDWYQKAANNGHLISLCSIADILIHGKGIATDVTKGLALCTQVANAESAPAMLKLAEYYQGIAGIPQNLTLSRYWYQQAAQRYSIEAQYQLGIMLSEGKGGEPDIEKALFWLETAASQGYAKAYLPTAILYANLPVQPETGALSPEYLAKIYLWNTAARERTQDSTQLAEIERIQQMVTSVMPETWRAKLDGQVQAHLAQFSARIE